MTVVEHLTELRTRLMISLVAVAIGATICFIFAPDIISFLIRFYKDSTPDAPDKLIFTGPLDAFGTRLKIATYGGIVLAMPVWLWQLWRFITPGLNPTEKRYAIPFLFASLFLFACGAVVALLTLEPALHFLLGIGGSDLQPLLTADKYISLVSLMIVAFGISFEFPVVLVFLLIAHVLTTRAAAPLAAVRRGPDRAVRRGDHAEPGSLLPVRDGGTHVRVLRGVHPDRKVPEAMSPPKRRGTYKPPRNRRELTIAVLSSLAIIVVTAVLIWVLRPNKDLGSSPEPVATVPAVTTVAPTTLRAHRHHGGAGRHHARRHHRGNDALTTPERSWMPDDLRKRFEATRGFPLDPFQQRALDALDAGEHVLVAAPTGSGKTVVAEYAVERALAAGAKAFYTTPLKALSNQKYGDLVRVHGTSQVGLLTGDNSINGDAPIVVMTTEVLRNMIYAASPALDGLRWVVLDEVHYLQDRYRGPVWEEVIVHLDASRRSGVPVGHGVERRGGRHLDRDRPRPHRGGHRGAPAGDAREPVPGGGAGSRHAPPAPDVQHAERPAPTQPRRRPARRARHPARRQRAAVPRTSLRTPSRVETVERLDAEEHAPRDRVRVQPGRLRPGGAAVPRRRAPAHRSRRARARSGRSRRRRRDSLPDADLEVLRYDSWLAGLEAGFAAHHAGMVPPMKEAVEEAFAAGLAKVVFATETLALGINMPARSVVIEKVSKFTGERHEFLTPGEYTQLTGRAGRRGIDERGYAIVCWSPFVPFEQVASLASRRTDALRSSFRPTYNMAANLVRRYSQFEAHHLLNLSFAQFHADRDVVALERQLDRSRQMLERRRAAAESDAGDVDEYRRLKGELDAARKNRGGTRRLAEALDALRPGDIVVTRRYGGRLVVLSHEHRRNGAPRIVGLSPNRQVVRLGPDDFDTPPRRVGHDPAAGPVRAAQPGVPAPDRRAPAPGEAPRRRPRRARRRARITELEEQLAEHPAARDPQLDARLRGAEAIERLERDVNRLERRVRGRSESLARQFDRVLRVLEAWGYVDGWSLTPAGSSSPACTPRPICSSPKPSAKGCSTA